MCRKIFLYNMSPYHPVSMYDQGCQVWPFRGQKIWSFLKTVGLKILEIY